MLHWHHFYDKSTTAVGLVSDGLFHAFSWFATVASLFMVAKLRSRKAWHKKYWMGAAIFSAGVFQLYDGIVQHKLMQLHQIRYVVDVFYYDVVWNVIAVLFIIIGWWILRRQRVRAT